MVSLISSHLSLLSLSLFPHVGAPMSGSRQRLQQLEAGVNLGGASCTTKQEAEQNSILFTSDKKHLRGARTLSRPAEALQVCLAAAGKKTLSTRSLKNSHVSRFGNARENLLVLHQISCKGLVRATPFHPRRVHASRTPTWTLKHTNHGTTKLKMFFTRCLVRVVSSSIALCDDLRCDNGHALLSGMMVLASLRVMHRVMIPCASSPLLLLSSSGETRRGRHWHGRRPQGQHPEFGENLGITLWGGFGCHWARGREDHFSIFFITNNVGRSCVGRWKINKRRWRWGVYETGYFKLLRSTGNLHVLWRHTWVTSLHKSTRQPRNTTQLHASTHELAL